MLEALITAVTPYRPGWLELPEAYGAKVWGLAKGRTHKYIKRVPKAGGGYRYYYNVAHGGGVHHADHFVEGASFRHGDGHYHITHASGDSVTIKHDESGHTHTVSKAELGKTLREHHAAALKSHHEKATKDLADAKAAGASPKQIAKLESRAKVGAEEKPKVTAAPYRETASKVIGGTVSDGVLRPSEYGHDLKPGDTVAVEGGGREWLVTVEKPKGHEFSVSVVGDGREMPMPKIRDASGYILPSTPGHAHAKNWSAGQVVEVNGEFWKVKGAPRKIDRIQDRITTLPKSDRGPGFAYTLVPSTREEFEASQGDHKPKKSSVRMSSKADAYGSIGSAVKNKDGEWVHVKDVKRTPFQSAAGGGDVWEAIGTTVPPEKAAKINELHGPNLSDALRKFKGEDVAERMSYAAKTLVPGDWWSSAASGERVEIVDGAVLHEREGSGKNGEGWRHYVVKITDPKAVSLVKRFLAKKES